MRAGAEIEGKNVWIGGSPVRKEWKGARIVRLDGRVKGERVFAWSEGALRCSGTVSIDSLYFEENIVDN